MSKLTLKFELVEVDHHTRKPLQGALHEVEIDAPELEAKDLDGSLRENLVDFDRAARNAVAARRVDYDDFKGDSEYLNTIDRVADDYYTVSVSIEGAAVKKYTAEGIYPEDGGLWGDEVSGVNASEAEFQAAWTMAENADGPIESRIYRDTTPQQSIESQLASMEDQRIEAVDIAKPSREDAFMALSRLCAVARKAGLKDEALAEAESLVAADNEAADASRDDDIRYLETVSPMAAP